MKKLILVNRQSPGDILMLTAAVRDLHRCYPGEFVTDVRTTARDLWLHNPYVTSIADDDPEATIVKCEYPLIAKCHESACHFLHGFMQFFNEKLGLNIQPTAFKGDIHLSADELAMPSPMVERVGSDVPYWIVAAGGKFDFTTKWWLSRNYQAVVAHFQDRIQFVQVGQKGHYHPRLDGVIDMRGQTDLRGMIRFMYHAQGVLCPVTFLMHLAAAVPCAGHLPPERPCVVVAGGREPPHWEAYPHHQFMHNVGTLSCNAERACWRARTVPIGDGDEKDDRAACCLDVTNGAPRCMEMVTPSDVARRIESYFMNPLVAYLDPEGGKRSRLQRTRSLEDEFGMDAIASRSGSTDSAGIPSVTLCVLTYGDHLELVRKAIESILVFGNRQLYRLVVGANAPGLATQAFLRQLERKGEVDRLIISDTNVNKCPMMRRMLEDLDTDYVWWLDDDSFFTEPGVMDAWLEEAEQSPPEIVMWGHTAYIEYAPEAHLDGHTAEWFVRTAEWSRGLVPPSEPGAEIAQSFIRHPEGDSQRWYFVLGGGWLIRAEALRATGWPDRRLTKGHDDVFLGEALRQQGLGIACRRKGMAINQACRRGDA